MKYESGSVTFTSDVSEGIAQKCHHIRKQKPFQLRKMQAGKPVERQLSLLLPALAVVHEDSAVGSRCSRSAPFTYRTQPGEASDMFSFTTCFKIQNLYFSCEGAILKKKSTHHSLKALSSTGDVKLGDRTSSLSCAYGHSRSKRH